MERLDILLVQRLIRMNDADVVRAADDPVERVLVILQHIQRVAHLAEEIGGAADEIERRTGALVVAVLLDDGRQLFIDVGGALFQGLRVGEQLLNGRLVGAFLCGIVRLHLGDHAPDAVGELEVFRLDTGVQAVDLAARSGEDELGEHGVIGIVENAQALELGQLACGVQNVVSGFTGVGGRGVLRVCEQLCHALIHLLTVAVGLREGDVLLNVLAGVDDRGVLGGLGDRCRAAVREMGEHLLDGVALTHRPDGGEVIFREGSFAGHGRERNGGVAFFFTGLVPDKRVERSGRVVAGGEFAAGRIRGQPSRNTSKVWTAVRNDAGNIAVFVLGFVTSVTGQTAYFIYS